jgi:hypothetical protein
LLESSGQTTHGNGMPVLSVECMQLTESGFTQSQRLLDDRIEHRDEIARRGIDDLEHLGCRSLLVKRLALLVKQPRVLHRDHRLRREVLQHGDFLVGERPDLAAPRHDHAQKQFVFAQWYEQHSADAIELERISQKRKIRSRRVCDLNEPRSVKQLASCRMDGSSIALPRLISVCVG